MSDWDEPFEAAYRFMRVSRKTGDEVQELTSFTQGGSIERNDDTAVKESGTAHVIGAFDIGSDFVRVYLDATGLYTGWKESVALGTFIPYVSERDIDGQLSESDVKLYGRLKDADEDDFDGPISIPAGSYPVAEAKKILEGCGLNVIADASSYQLSATWTFGLESGEEGKLSAVNALLAIAGFASASTDPMGNVMLRRYVEPSERPSKHLFEEGENARFLGQVVDERDTSGVANVVKAVYSTQEKTVIGIAVNDDQESPYSTVSMGRRIVKTYRYNDTVTQDEANAKAKSLLDTEQSVIRRLSISHVFVPGLSTSDAVSVEFPSGSVSGKFATRTQKIELDRAALTSAEVKRSEK